MLSSESLTHQEDRMQPGQTLPDGSFTGVPFDVNERATFITRTYTHLFGAICGFTALEIYYFSSGLAETMARAMLGTSWLLVLGAFMVVGWLASRAAMSAETKPMQYAALGGFVVAKSIIFVPLLYVANSYAPGTIQSAAWVTILGFMGLTAVAFITKKDFSFLKGIVTFGMIAALIGIAASILLGFTLGTWFSVLMIGLAGAAILWETSDIMRTFPQDRYVGASLQLFASVALMFWYVLQLFMSRD